MHVVKDVKHIMILFILLPIGIIAFLYGIIDFIGSPRTASLLTAIFFSLALIVLYKRLKAVYPGTIVDTVNDTISFNGGGIAANDITDFFKASYLLQFIRRQTVNLSDIRQIATDCEVNVSDKGGVSYKYFLNFNGDFGAVRIRFQSEAKRDELYSLIRATNRMGTAIVRDRG